MEFPPHKLYRYFSNIDYAIQLVDKHEMFFSGPDDFNDPNELLPSVIGMEEHAEFLYGLQGIDGSNIKESFKSASNDYKHRILSNMRAPFRVYCLTEIWSSYHMWSHYSKGFKGCCIALNSGEIMNSENKINFLFKVHYSSTRKSFSDMTLGNEIERFRIFVANKNRAYSEEKEWRIVKYLNHNNPLLFCPENGIIKIAPGIAQEIIIGSKTPLEDVEKLLETARRNNLKVSKIQTHIGNDEFKIIKTTV